jgi:two-component system, NtrC family, nitrogen regulation sensor histidine kinase NtrY
MPRFSRFELRILLAILLSGLVPFVIALRFFPPVVEEIVEPQNYEKVLDQLETTTTLYKEIFDAKKREFGARVEAMSRDPVLIRAARETRLEDVEARLKGIVDDQNDVQSLKLLSTSGELIVKVDGPPERHTEEFMSRTVQQPLGASVEAPTLSVSFIVPSRYKNAQNDAAEVTESYDNIIRAWPARVAEITRNYALFVSAVIALGLALGYVLARRVTKRIARLASATERVSRGDLEFNIPLRGADEITELTRAFNKMITEVKDARDRIVYLEKVSGWQEFARRLAHEIKNPLTPIQLAVQELRRRTPEGDESFQRLVADAADVVEEEIASLTRLVDEFSQFARLPEVVPEDVEVRSFMEEFLAAYNRFEPDAELHTDLPAEPIFAGIDRVLMRRVFANLATNAIQAAGAGKAKLWIGVKKSPEGEVVIRFADNGPGVPEEMAARIFDPYFTTKSEGTGLGLAIVKKIVLQHGGTISLSSSEEGGGAAFVIVLPGRSSPG